MPGATVSLRRMPAARRFLTADGTAGYTGWVADALDPYRRKRDFAATPEPPAEDPDPGGGGGRFVVQEHHARRLHWDFRLERDGVLVSWAVPRGIPRDPSTNHLAVHVEDHPLSYIDFAGEIPKGSYGAGTVSIWDHGTYECLKFRPDEVMVVLHGERLHGKYVLFRTRGQDWMIHRMDPPEDPGWEALPTRLRPMLARLAELPARDELYAFEIKWDGIRALVSVEGGRVRVETRTGKDLRRRRRAGAGGGRSSRRRPHDSRRGAQVRARRDRDGAPGRHLDEVERSGRRRGVRHEAAGDRPDHDRSQAGRDRHAAARARGRLDEDAERRCG